jgi:hypothetical protein
MSVGPNLASVSDDPDTERSPVPRRFLDALEVSLPAPPVQLVPRQVMLLRSLDCGENIRQHLKRRPPLIVRKISVTYAGHSLPGLVRIVREQFESTAQERQLWRRSIVHSKPLLFAFLGKPNLRHPATKLMARFSITRVGKVRAR